MSAAKFDEKWTLASSGCWEWGGTLERSGYGRAWREGRNQLAHRVSLKIRGVDVPNSVVVMHHCDNRKCVNPNHLKISTQSENMLDASRKGRLYRVSGAQHPNAKLTEEKVAQMRQLRAVGVSWARIATAFGVAASTARNAILGVNWRKP